MYYRGYDDDEIVECGPTNGRSYSTDMEEEDIAAG